MTARLKPLPADTNPELQEHFRKIEGLIGFVPNSTNRWNDTMATALEGAPAEVAKDVYGDFGWSTGRHG